MEELEFCCICDEPTGNAGILDGSLFDVDGGGPYCGECWNNLSDELKEESIDPDEYNDNCWVHDPDMGSRG